MATRRGTAGDDRLTGTGRADVIRGFAGNDTIDPGLGADLIWAGEGDDVILFGSVMTSWPAPVDVGSIDGGSGYDTIDLRQVAPVRIGGTAEQLAITVGSQTLEVIGVERILLGSADNASDLPLFYTGPQVEMRAGDGADYFQGSGNFALYGEEGDDSFWIAGVFGPTTNGVLDGGAGFDTLALFNGMSLDIKEGMLRSGSASYAISSFERFVAGADSTVLGSERADVVSVRGLGDYDFQGMYVDGRGGHDLLSRSQSRDTILGGAGDDRLRGSGRGDTLTGGSGRDVFAYDADDSSPAETDRITDFRIGEDRIDLSAIDADPATPRADRLQFIGKAGFSGEAGELRYGLEKGTTVIEADLNGDGVSDLSVILDGRHGLSRGDFVFAGTVDTAAPAFGDALVTGPFCLP